VAKRTVTLLSCDMPHDAPATNDIVAVSVGFEGRVFDLDLCPEHATEYHDFMRRLLAHATPKGTTLKRSTKAKAPGAPATGAIRAWAREHGHTVPSRGRMATALHHAFEESVEKVAEVAGVAKRPERTSGPADTAAIRAWALANGHKVADRGRIPAAVVEAYETAQ
jgi:hypothetical protein